MRKIDILLPVETIARELDYRLFLGAYFARKHRRIFIGHAPAIDRVALNTSRGIYIGKTAFYRRPNGKLIYHESKAHGHVMIHHPEEGAVFQGREDAWDSELARALDPCELAADDHACTWGDYQTEFYKKAKPACTDHIVTVGHPRFDLCAPKYYDIYAEDVARLRANYGEFVLINSNFAIANTPLGVQSTFSPYMGYEAKDPVIRERFVAMWARMARTLPSFVELVHKLSLRRPDMNFVFRPHPSDDETYFHGVFNGIPNIHVIRQGAVGPWILASRALVHDGSTSGLEGHLYDRPVVNYAPETDPDSGIYLPNVVGTTCITLEHAMETVLDILERKQQGATPIDLPERALRLFHNFGRETFPGLLEVMERAEEQVCDGRYARAVTARLRLSELRAAAVESAKQVVRPLSPVRYRTAREIRALFPGFDPQTLKRTLAIVRRLTGNPVEITFHSSKLIEMISPRP